MNCLAIEARPTKAASVKKTHGRDTTWLVAKLLHSSWQYARYPCHLRLRSILSCAVRLLTCSAIWDSELWHMTSISHALNICTHLRCANVHWIMTHYSSMCARMCHSDRSFSSTRLPPPTPSSQIILNLLTDVTVNQRSERAREGILESLIAVAWWPFLPALYVRT